MKAIENSIKLPIKKPFIFLIIYYIIIVDEKNYTVTETEETS